MLPTCKEPTTVHLVFIFHFTQNERKWDFDQYFCVFKCNSYQIFHVIQKSAVYSLFYILLRIFTWPATYVNKLFGQWIDGWIFIW